MTNLDFAIASSTDTCCFLDAPPRPSELPECDDLFFLFFAQDIAHVDEADEAYKGSRRSQCPGLYCGRFWVTPEVEGPGVAGRVQQMFSRSFGQVP
jgi:hypothetical protein